MPGRSPAWKGERGDGGIVVYGRNTIRTLWAENDDLAGEVEEFGDVFNFESSSMYPFSAMGAGEYHIDEILWDADTETIVVMLDD